jgi:dihydrofolate synthase/folylpolyglutamate synthase
VREGIALTHWPGRLQLEEVAGTTWLFDVAHNVAGVETLAAALATLPVPRPITVLVGVLGDKDWRGMIAPLHELAEGLLLTMPPTAPAERRWDPAEVIASVPSARAEIVEDFSTALERAHARAAAHGGTVVVTGSFHTVGDALAALGRCADGTDITMPAPVFITTAEDTHA